MSFVAVVALVAREKKMRHDQRNSRDDSRPLTTEPERTEDVLQQAPVTTDEEATPVHYQYFDVFETPWP